MSVENLRVLQALERLAITLKELPSHKSPKELSHWRRSTSKISPGRSLEKDTHNHDDDDKNGLTMAWLMMDQGRLLVHSTSTKYTLVSQVDMEKGSNLAQELLRGCEHLGTAALLVHDDAMGCCRSLRKAVQQYVRSIVQTCIHLMNILVSIGNDSTNLNENSTISPAAATGAIWDACDKFPLVPNSNRNAMRRDLLTWIRECQDTVQEFEDVLALPTVSSSSSTPVTTNNTTTWEMFTSGNSDAYTDIEHPIALSSLALIKCTRGTLKVLLEVSDVVAEATSSSSSSDSSSDSSGINLVSLLHEEARSLGEGMTELGSLLYSPLDLDELYMRVTSQSEALLALITRIIQRTDDIQPSKEETSSMSSTRNLAETIRTAILTRTQETYTSIESAKVVTTSEVARQI
jgi:hypothetical protein